MDGLHALLKLLNRVNARGWTDALSDASGDNGQHKTSVENYPQYSEPLLTLRKEMEHARLCLRAVDDIRRHLKQRLRALRRVGMPLVLEDGIKRLPDNVLAVIFYHRMRMPRDAVFPSIQISHVSHRFRRIALRTPSLWTTVDDYDGESQIREFVARSGRLDLEVKVCGVMYCSNTESFLKVLKDTSHRWSSFNIPDVETKSFMTGLGITDFPRLKHLTYTCPIDLSAFAMPKLSRLEALGLPARSRFLAQLSYVQLDLWTDAVGIGDLTNALHGMTNVMDLSLTLEDCVVTNESLPLDSTAFPKPHSVHINRLAISIIGEKRQYSALLFDALVHFTPSLFELSINSERLDKFLYTSRHWFFPYSPAIKLHISTGVDVIGILHELVKGCDIIRTVHFDTPMGRDLDMLTARRLPDSDWERIRCLDHLRFINCDGFSESALGAFANKFLRGRAENGLHCLEIISCKKISEDFLLELEDEFGDRLKWSL
ncbi:hypothetical protein BD410DRAFT_900311 [Rickenella mellea]|uniref:F-box domain-containing protein n=1 Tax=Rickenella mellea TaxID=50990 RepID=A0A4Y7PWI7_9AGAM|nr:hypothetical protein BD410DRAFT_900311 [Rickenella mellea]